MKFTSVDVPYLELKYLNSLKSISGISEVILSKDSPSLKSEIIDRIGDSELVTADITTIIDSEVLSKTPNLKAIFCQAVGYDNVDVEFAKSKGIKVYNCAGFNARAVSEFAFAIITALLRKIPGAQEHVRAGGWSYNYFIGNELYAKTVGIIGSGNVAKYIAKIARGYDMNILAYTRNPNEEKAKSMGIAKFSNLEYLLGNSDIVILAVPLSKDSYHLIGVDEIAMMKKTSILVNVARHTIVDETALAQALIDKKIAGAALDMMYTEPFNVHEYNMMIKEVVRLPNFILTPHIAGVSVESRTHLGKIFVQNVNDFLIGVDTNCVNL